MIDGMATSLMFISSLSNHYIKILFTLRIPKCLFFNLYNFNIFGARKMANNYYFKEIEKTKLIPNYNRQLYYIHPMHTHTHKHTTHTRIRT